LEQRGGEVLGALCGENGVGAGHIAFTLKLPGEQWIGARGGGPVGVGGAEEEDGVEERGFGFSDAHDLDLRVGGGRCEEGGLGLALERFDSGGEGDAATAEVECGDEVEDAVPGDGCGKLGCVERASTGPVGGCGEAADEGHPVGVGARFFQVFSLEKGMRVAEPCEERLILSVLRVVGELEQGGDVDFRAEEPGLAEGVGVEDGAGVALGEVAKVGREEQRADAREGEGVVGPAGQVECVGDKRKGGEGCAAGGLPGRGREVGADGLQLGRECFAEDVFERGAVGCQVGEEDGDAGAGLVAEEE
jgi:hypothetical protein